MKQKLKTLKVQSFITNLKNENSNTVKGGAPAGTIYACTIGYDDCQGEIDGNSNIGRCSALTDCGNQSATYCGIPFNGQQREVPTSGILIQ